MATEKVGLPEEWRAVVGCEGSYEVSNLGRVRSLDRMVGGNRAGHQRIQRGTVLAAGTHPSRGYQYVHLRSGGPGTKTVHRLVLEAFRGLCPDGMEAAHLDGNPANNRLDNLAWVTPKENAWHRHIHGTQHMGERSGTAVLTAAHVLELRDRYLAGALLRELAGDYGVSLTTVWAAVKGKSWRHVTGGVDIRRSHPT